MFTKYTIPALFTLLTTITATLDPATSHTNGSYPSAPKCARTSLPSILLAAFPLPVLLDISPLTPLATAIKTSKAIQAAECSHNTRTSAQTFAVFTQDHQYDSAHGAPYGTCEAYNCAPGTAMKTKQDIWTFFWDKAGVKGAESGEGMGCIKSPKDGKCGCENSDGTFIAGGSNCK